MSKAEDLEQLERLAVDAGEQAGAAAAGAVQAFATALGAVLERKLWAEIYALEYARERRTGGSSGSAERSALAAACRALELMRAGLEPAEESRCGWYRGGEPWKQCRLPTGHAGAHVLPEPPALRGRRGPGLSECCGHYPCVCGTQPRKPGELELCGKPVGDGRNCVAAPGHMGPHVGALVSAELGRYDFDRPVPARLELEDCDKGATTDGAGAEGFSGTSSGERQP